MKYAIFAHGGKQYLAEEGARIEVDRMPLDVGKPVEFHEILLVSDGNQIEVGSPFVSGAKVQGTVVEHPNGKKIIVFKYQPKQRYRRTKGQRRRLTTISIEAVGIAGAEEPAPPPPRKAAAKPAAKPPVKPPVKRASAKRGSVKSSGPARKTAGKPKSTRAKKK